MCGISGFINSGLTYEDLKKLTDSMYRRGPDASGYYYEDNLGLGHRRLSIIELSPLGAQPYQFENLILVFNGELYNYKEIRVNLELKGYSFNSNSDTEVLIKAFHCWGVQSVQQFIGMFSFAIYNKSNKELYLFRDRIGIKPLYYSFENGGLVFASELKGLKSVLKNLTISAEATLNFFQFGYTSNNLSIFNSILKLPAGHYMRYHNGSMSLTCYWDINEVTKTTNKKTLPEIKEELKELLISSFKYRMVADVPVGVFLSGGTDSSLLTAMLQEQYGNIKTFTVGFDDSRFDESGYARRVSKILNTEHFESILSPNKAIEILNQYYDIVDEPFSDSSLIPTSFVAMQAKNAGVKVVLSADGGDELFAGYSRYNDSINLHSKFNSAWYFQFLKLLNIHKFLNKDFIHEIYYKNIGHKAGKLIDLLNSRSFIHFYEIYISNQSSSSINKLLVSNQENITNTPQLAIQENGLLRQMCLWDIQHYLQDDLLAKVDLSTMYHSIEGREPFLDHRLLEYALSLPDEMKISNNTNKFILKEILKEYLPNDLVYRQKKGFSIPIFKWFSNELNFLFEKYFTKEMLRQNKVLSSKEVLREYEKFKYYTLQGKEYNIEKLWRILIFMIWEEKNNS